jgi:hypothetical protein
MMIRPLTELPVERGDWHTAFPLVKPSPLWYIDAELVAGRVELWVDAASLPTWLYWRSWLSAW